MTSGLLFTSGSRGLSPRGSPGSPTSLDGDGSLFFPPHVAVHLVKLACERPDKLGRSLSQWDCMELARELIASGIVVSISHDTVGRILNHHKLKPWRHHMWLTPKKPRDTEFYSRVSNVIDLYTRDLADDEVVLSLDEKTCIQPRPRLHETKPARPGLPNRVEHEYKRDGALNLIAAFDTRTGHVYGKCYERKRQVEVIDLLDHIDERVSPRVKKIHIISDNSKTHSGKEVQRWMKTHPRFVFHFTPVHCSWMNQIEQWFSILQRKRLRISDFSSKADLSSKITLFIDQWNQRAHPFNWTTKSVAKIMAKAEAERLAA